MSENVKKTITDQIIFPVPYSLDEYTENIIINSEKKKNKLTRDEIISKAFLFHRQGNINQAEKYYKYFLDQGFSDPIIFSNLGTICEKKGKLALAKDLYQQSIDLFPFCPEAYSNLGLLLKNQGNKKKAEILIRKAIDLKPDFVDAYSNLGSLLIESNRIKEAFIFLKKAIELKPDLAEAHNNLGNIYALLDNPEDAEISLKKAINFNPNLYSAYVNLGSTLQNIGKTDEAKKYLYKAIKIDSKQSSGYCNLAKLFVDIGMLDKAESTIVQAIKIKPDCGLAYYIFSVLNPYDSYEYIYKNIFSDSLLDGLNQKDKIYLYFSRANIFHKRGDFKKSAKYLQIANNLKLTKIGSDLKIRLERSNKLLNDSRKYNLNTFDSKSKQAIFIVGLPRCGSTLLESILSMNYDSIDLGETNIFDKLFLKWSKQSNKEKLNLEELYYEKINKISGRAVISINKMLYNYQYTSIIASQIANSKIFHCLRNPLDNILSMYRAHFSEGNKYTSSLEDCAKLYLDHEDIMDEYKREYRSRIYDLNYDLLVKNPNKEIRALISWLGWEWDEKYLSPHLNTRSVSTASSVQVRYPIHSKSVGGWKNYRDMLQPSIDILTKTEKYKNLRFS